MYTIPADFNPLQLKGAIVQQISFGLNVITIEFNLSRYISFEGSFIMTDLSQNVSNQFVVYPVTNDFGILKLLEKSVEDIVIKKPNNDLLLSFDNKIMLTILASNEYESYVIKTNEILIRI